MSHLKQHDQRLGYEKSRKDIENIETWEVKTGDAREIATTVITTESYFQSPDLE